jgi:tellurite resistance protein
MEPDVLGGAKVPKADDNVALFAVPPSEGASRATPSYQAALLSLQLASAVAAADGEFSVKELSHLRGHVLSWTHLTPGHTRRLLAQLRLLMTSPMTLGDLKKRLEPLDPTARETIAAFMATVAQSDGLVSPTEVKMLEKVYKALGVDPKKVFSDVHAAASGAAIASEPVPPTPKTGFALDAAKIASLQRDSEQVSKLLAGIFVEDEPAVSVAVEVVDDADVEVEPPATGLSVAGLDEPHSKFAKLLLTRPTWTRDELQEAAEDLELMLDGALEQINDAWFDKFDGPLTEGEDPVEVNRETFEKAEA